MISSFPEPAGVKAKTTSIHSIVNELILFINFVKGIIRMNYRKYSASSFSLPYIDVSVQ